MVKTASPVKLETLNWLIRLYR